ncbi:MAG: glycosyltransferase family 39 protein, partial [Fimbriimonadaceae bacterium]|nr:glycosyltransferase family 39 protein [Fimbriimonadaceae bacterium]
LAALMLASSLLVVACSRQLMTDMPLVLAEMAASYSFWRSLTEGRHWRLLTAFWLGVSVLAKGPVGVILFLILMGCTYWREPALRPKFAGYWGLGGLIFFAVVATWTVPAFLTNREFFVQEFLIRQNIGRFAGGDIAHTPNRLAGLLVYLPILLLGAFPWSLALPKAWKALAAHDPFVRYNFRWFITVFIFFTVTGAKLMHYVLPAVPAMIVIVAIYAADRWRTRGEVRPMRPLLAPIVGILVTTLLVNVGQWWYYGGATFAMPGKELKFNAPYQEELHSCTKVARNRKLPIVVYQMGKRPGAQTLLQETSHPSVVYYANDVVGVAESPGDLERLKRPYALLTRVSRITPELKKQLIGQGATPFMGGIQYVIWRVP